MLRFQLALANQLLQTEIRHVYQKIISNNLQLDAKYITLDVIFGKFYINSSNCYAQTQSRQKNQLRHTKLYPERICLV